jgi:exopolysaccharide biosynthesis polyprenyl glycosylphosphotransferase
VGVQSPPSPASFGEAPATREIPPRTGGRRFRLPGVRLARNLAAGDVLILTAAAVWARDQVPLPLGLTLVLAVVLLYGQGELYRARLSLSVLDDLPALVARTLLAGALITALQVFITGDANEGIVRLAAIFAALATVVRAAGYSLLRNARRRGMFVHRTLVLGGGQVAQDLVRVLLEHPEHGLKPVGFLDSNPLHPAEDWPVPRLGSDHELIEVIHRANVGNVVVAFGSTPESRVVDLLRACDRMACEIFFVPRLYEMSAVGKGMELVWGLPLVRLRRAPFRSLSWKLKRVVDVILAALGLLLLTPVLLLCAFAVWAEVRRPILFRQERVGLDGRPFTVLKFCSLRPTEASGGDRQWSVTQDDWIGPVGRLLRRTSLDELPQLWNILRGDMSLVGPRPERPYFVQEFRRRFPRYMARHRVPAGLTGAAQVHGLRGDTSIGDRARFDNYYIENWSLWEDFKIMLWTIGQIVRASGK